MIAVLNELVRRERRYFGLLAQRIEEFASTQQHNDIFRQIFTAYHDAYQAGTAALFHFERANVGYQRGQSRWLAEIGGINVPSSPSGGKVAALAASTRLPSMIFRERFHRHIRKICHELTSALAFVNDEEELQNDLEMIASLLASFEHIESNEQESKESSWWGAVASFGLGACTGFGAHKEIRQVIKSLKP